MVGSVDVEAAKDRAEAPKGTSHRISCPTYHSPAFFASTGYSSPRSTGYAVETSGKLWSVYLAESERHDKALAESWKADMDGLLIFVSQPVSHVAMPMHDLLYYNRRLVFSLPW
jgi:hypothetical protein